MRWKKTFNLIVIYAFNLTLFNLKFVNMYILVILFWQLIFNDNKIIKLKFQHLLHYKCIEILMFSQYIELKY